MKAQTAIILGAGARGGMSYAPYAESFPNELNIVGIAEPIKERREQIVKKHDISEENVFNTWQEMLATHKRLADIAIIATMDRDHYLPTLQALKLGYHVLLEKPISPDPKECIELEQAAKKYDRHLAIGHVLRYTKFWQEIRRNVQEGVIGQVASLQLNENVEIMHMSHSFVRGNWRNKEQSSPMILQKSCHDMDIINYVIGKKCERVSSYGSLMYFNEENKPEGATKRCLDGCPVANECPFHAGRFYLGEGRGWAGYFAEEGTNEAIIQGLHDTNFGACVYQTDNNVVDHQVVNMEFEDGATATFSMCGFTREQTRIVQVMGTKGEIRGNMENNEISIYDFLTKKETVIKFPEPIDGHGGGDYGIVRTFLDDVKNYGKSESLSSVAVSIRSHLMAFAAEDSRLNRGESIELDEYYQKILNP